MSSYFLLHGQRFALSAISPSKGMEIGKRGSHETQFFYLQKGFVSVEDERGYWTVGPGQLAWMPPYIRYETEQIGRIAGWGVTLSSLLCVGMPEVACALYCSPFVPLILERAHQWLQKDDSVYQTLQPRQEVMLQVFMDELRYSSRTQDRLILPKGKRLNTMAKDILANPSNRKSINDWADKTGISARSISRHFSSETNMTFAQWRLRASLMVARKKLALGESVHEVAQAVGYENVSAFIASYKKAYNQTPAQFRQLFE